MDEREQFDEEKKLLHAWPSDGGIATPAASRIGSNLEIVEIGRHLEKVERGATIRLKHLGPVL
jgi:hypothetical protein